MAYMSLVHFCSIINQYKCIYVTAKIAKQCRIGMTEQIPIKFGDFNEIKINLVQTMLVDKHINISVKNIHGNSYIGQYSKGQISVDNIGEPTILAGL